ncbi:thiamine ABC transporter ATP-binding protein [Vibrio sp. HA2012]|uniref:thiamine ABC transporter ATP-binding protein n=1 Tax=Vibrio sp. HA2012 TaxID=1971595 RepID=UPI000C2B8828|nr:thiamine ABC transporter ATP-binding protein [Vibrio sp. HA2012]PJC85786.1 thiamine ABC transporter ATP-binding protein [Vibrio sp. HA2012]
MLDIQAVSYRYHEEEFRFDLSVKQGSITALMGPSGAGKSTLLALIAGFIQPHQGDILFNGESLLGDEPYQRPFSILFQEHNLFTHLTVRENIGLGLNPGLKLSAEQKQQIEYAAEQVGVEGFLDRLPDQLSGGQKQRVSLARCFVQPHPVWLLDEPFSALDPILREEMLALVKRLANERGITVVMVTHHISDARAIASDFIFMAQGEVLVRDSVDKLHSTHPDIALSTFVRAGE